MLETNAPINGAQSKTPFLNPTKKKKNVFVFGFGFRYTITKCSARR